MWREEEERGWGREDYGAGWGERGRVVREVEVKSRGLEG